jgi:hypothetical protein
LDSQPAKAWRTQRTTAITRAVTALVPRQKRRREPDWNRLALWNALRAEFLGETEPQPIPVGEHRFEH